MSIKATALKIDYISEVAMPQIDRSFLQKTMHPITYMTTAPTRSETALTIAEVLFAIRQLPSNSVKT